MSLGLSENRNRRRRQGRFVLMLLRWLFIVAVAVAAGYYAYDFGTELAREDVKVLEMRLARADAENAQLGTDITGLEAALREERVLVAQWRDRYEAEVPSAENATSVTPRASRVSCGLRSSPRQMRMVPLLSAVATNRPSGE